MRAGYLGGLAAWTGFTLPSAVALVLSPMAQARFKVRSARDCCTASSSLPWPSSPRRFGAGPCAQLIAAIVEMKHRNPKFGCVRIAQQIGHAFGIEIDNDVVRRMLGKHFRPDPGADGPSWLTLIAHAKDSVWSVHLFRVQSILLRSHLVMLVMDSSLVETARVPRSGSSDRQ
jgi:hypothetical protein